METNNEDTIRKIRWPFEQRINSLQKTCAFTESSFVSKEISKLCTKSRKERRKRIHICPTVNQAFIIVLQLQQLFVEYQFAYAIATPNISRVETMPSIKLTAVLSSIPELCNQARELQSQFVSEAPSSHCYIKGFHCVREQESANCNKTIATSMNDYYCSLVTFFSLAIVNLFCLLYLQDLDGLALIFVISAGTALNVGSFPECQDASA